MLFGGLYSRLEPAGRLREGRLSADKADVKPQSTAVEAVTSEIHVKAGRLRPTGRILPDLLQQSGAETRLRQELEEREVRLRAQKSASEPSSISKPKRAKVEANVEVHAARTAVLEPTPTAKVSLKEPVLTAMEIVASAAVEPITALRPTPPSSPRQRTGTARGTSRRPTNQAGVHRSERQEAFVLLRTGEKWKRRLPRVCW